MTFFMGIGVIKYLIPMAGWWLLVPVVTVASAWLLGLLIAYLAKKRHGQYLGWSLGIITTQAWPWMREAKWRIALFFAGAIVAAFI